MANKTIPHGITSPTASEAINACSLQAAENKRQSTSLLDALLALNAQLIELDHAMAMAYSGA
jgi:hypothetical protein